MHRFVAVLVSAVAMILACATGAMGESPRGMAMLCFYNNNNCTGSFKCDYAPLNACRFRKEYNVSDEYVNCVVPPNGSNEYGYFTQRTYDGEGCGADKHAREMKLQTSQCVQGELFLCYP